MMAAFFNKDKMRLKLKNIVKWEQLMRLPFSKIDFTKEDHISAMIYICTEQRVDFQVFRKVSLSASFKKEVEYILSELQYIHQFQKEEDSGNQGVDCWIVDIAFSLIAKGIDASYVLESLSLIDLPYLIKAISEKEKEELESQRLWTYLTVLPHIDSRNLKSPQDIFPFPWEVESEIQRKEQEKTEAMDMFNQFVKHYGK